MNKIVVLNSGGYDSVVLLHELADKMVDCEIHSLFFNYSQANLEMERYCARRVADKLKLVHHEVVISPLSWVNKTMYLGDSTKCETQYMEMRNVVFLSYALSLAESIKADSIAMAILSGGTFTDTNAEFVDRTIEWISHITKGEIELYTPYINYTKYRLGYIANYYNIQPNEYFSCNAPRDNKPCGECADCIVLEDIANRPKLPVHAYIENGGNTNEDFNSLFSSSDIKEARLLINNLCQFNCSHCFYGFEDSEVLTKQEFYKIIDQVAEMGIKNIHFSGKEPMINRDIFDYANYIEENHPNLTCDVVTNGATIKKFEQELKDSILKRVYLSVDSLGDLTIRDCHTHQNIKSIKNANKEVEIFIDIHKDNYIEIKSIIEHLYHEDGVKDFFVRTILPIGKGKTFDKIVNVEELNEVYLDLLELDLEDVRVNFAIQTGYVNKIMKREDLAIYEGVVFVRDYKTSELTYNLSFIPEFYCHRFEDQITITQDGYVLGCATEVSNPKYRDYAYKVSDLGLKEIVQLGKEKQLKMVEKTYSDFSLKPCFHTYYTID